VDSQQSQEGEARICHDCGKLGHLAKQYKVYDIHKKFGNKFNSLKNQFETSINGVDLLFRPCAGNSKVYIADISTLRVVKGAALSQPAWSLKTASMMKENYTKAQVKAADLAAEL
jgi:hypothetical protein